jgi:D-aspartate ligase
VSSSGSVPPAVILGGGPIAVTVARSLGRAGVRVHALGDGAVDAVRNSRYLTKFVDVGSGSGVQERYFEWLRRGPRESVVLPCSDDALELVAHHRIELTELGYVLIEGNDAVMLAMLDKEHAYALARRVGVPAPRTLPIRSFEDLAAVSAAVGFPCALKPRHSHLFASQFGMRKKLYLTSDQSMLETIYSQLQPLGLELIATEIIRGDDDRFHSYYTYLDERGEPLLHFTKQKLRQFPPYFGLGSYHVSDWDDEVAELGLRYCQGSNLRGLAAVEFKRDAQDGQLKLIECNHRFTLATELLRHSGIDLPLLVYNRLSGRGKMTVGSYRSGVHLWFPVEDVCAFLTYRRRGELSFGRWAKSLACRQHFPVFSWTDPRPSITRYRRLSGMASRRLGWRLTRRRDAGRVGTLGDGGVRIR